MRELKTCHVCEEKEATWKYTFHKKGVAVTLEICDDCAELLMAESARRYRYFERIEEVKTLKLKR